MLFVEFFADKIPGVDTLWDMVHTLIRIPAGAALAASVFGVDQATGRWPRRCSAARWPRPATSRRRRRAPALNTSPEPFSNIAMSLLGDAAVPVSLWLPSPSRSGALVLALAIVMVARPGLFMRFLRGCARRVSGWFGAGQPST